MKRSTSKAAAALFAVGIFAGAPAVWLARAEPRARSAAQLPSDNGPGGRPSAYPPPGERTRAMRPAEQRPVSPTEWEEISEFMAEYMPWRIAEVQAMREGQWKERIKKLLANRYRGLRTIQARDPQSFQARLGQLRIEDQIYKLVSDLPKADPDGRQKIREELRTQVTQLVDVDLAERKRRVERLKAELTRQEGLLEQDTRQHDTLVDQRVNRFLTWGSRWPGQRGAGNGSAKTPGTGAARDAKGSPSGTQPGNERPEPDDEP